MSFDVTVVHAANSTIDYFIFYPIEVEDYFRLSKPKPTNVFSGKVLKCWALYSLQENVMLFRRSFASVVEWELAIGRESHNGNSQDKQT